jgi:DNA-binding response OmpR family regulator
VVGQGSTFTVKTVFQVSPSKASSLATEVHALPPSHAPEDRALPGAAPLASQRHLGIIENEASLQDAYREFFTKAGYVVHLIPYTEPEFNAALLQLPRPDVILSDFRLGDKDGVYFISRLREEFNDHIPACILTADTSPQHVLDFKAMGIDVLYKPIDVVSIEKFIAKQLALSGSAQDGSLQR